MNRKAVVWLTLCLIWGSTWLFIKLGLEDLPPVSFAGIRFLIATAILVSIVRIRRLAWPTTRKEWLLLFWTGMLTFTLNYGLLFWGEQRVTSGLAAILQTIIPVFGLMIAHYYLPSERMTWAKVGGVLLGIAGIVVIFFHQLAGESTAGFAGSIAIVVGAFAAAWSNVLVKARGTHLDPAVIAAGQMMFGFVPLLALGWAFEGNPFSFHWTTRAVISLFYLAIVGSCCAFLLYYWLVRHMAVTTTMLISLVTPVLAVLLGLWWLGEEFTWNIGFGAIAIMAGIGINIWSSKRSKQAMPVIEVEFERG